MESLTAAFAIVWASVAIYVGILGNRTRQLARRLDALENWDNGAGRSSRAA